MEAVFIRPRSRMTGTRHCRAEGCTTAYKQQESMAQKPSTCPVRHERLPWGTKCSAEGKCKNYDESVLQATKLISSSRHGRQRTTPCRNQAFLFLYRKATNVVSNNYASENPGTLGRVLYSYFHRSPCSVPRPVHSISCRFGLPRAA